MTRLAPWRGLVAMVGDAVTATSRAVEDIQKETARRSFYVLEQIPPLAATAGTVHRVHDLCVTGVHGSIRVVTRFVTAATDTVLAHADRAPTDTHPPPREPG